LRILLVCREKLSVDLPFAHILRWDSNWAGHVTKRDSVLDWCPLTKVGLVFVEGRKSAHRRRWDFAVVGAMDFVSDWCPQTKVGLNSGV